MLIKPFKALSVVLATVSLLWLSGVAGGFPTHAQPAPLLKIVATTSLIAEIAGELGGTAVEIATLIPPASCPGHFDIKPDDMKLLAVAQVFMLHNWQGRQFSDEIIRASGNRTLKKAVLAVPGNWMAPPAQVEATDRIAAVLAEADPPRAFAYRAAAERRKAEVQRIGAAQERRLAEAAVDAIFVLANDMQADFIRWSGFQIAGVFGRGEDMSPRDMEDAIRLGRAKAVRLVVDNLQSGKQAGIGIAKEIGAAQATLSNFPGGFADTGTWAKAIEKNVDLLLSAIGKP
jgi:ABC-type Zn uptake system ZnuABC Zn-binding protein ZnuA